MANEIQSHNELTPDQIKVLSTAGVIPDGTPPAVVSVFATACKEHGLSPFKKEIYLVKYNTKQGPQYHTIVGIDGVRVKAARTGQYAGIDDPKFDQMPDGSFKTAAQVKQSGKMPISCTVTVYRIIGGQRCPFTHTCVFDEFAPANGGFSKWATMPFQMIAKCTESFATKKAFGGELSGLHIEEEQAAFEDTQRSAPNTVTANIDSLIEKIANCWTVDALSELYNKNAWYKDYAHLFTERKLFIEKVKDGGDYNEMQAIIDKCHERMESCRMDDPTEIGFKARIARAETPAELWQVYAELENFVYDTGDPRAQLKNMKL